MPGNILDQVRIYMTKIEAATTQYDFNAAVDVGLDILGKLGVDISLQPSSEDYQRLKEKYFDFLKNRPTGVINALTEMTDERALATSDILAAELTPTFIINQEIYPIIGLIGANLTLEFGYNVWSPVFFAANGNIFWLGEDLGTPSDKLLDYLLFIRQMCEISLEMQQKPVYRRSQTRTLGQICVAGSYCLPANILIELAQTMFLSGFETGDLNYGGQGALHRSIYGLVFGKNLDTVRNQVTEELLLLKKFNQTAFATYISFFLQAAINFIEPSEESHRLLGRHIDEEAYLPAAEAANDNTGMHFFYAIRLMLSYHFDVDNELSELIGKAEKYIIAGPGLITVAITRIYAALSKLRLYPTLTPLNQEDALKIVDHSLQLMEIWSQSAPGTFQHLYDLIRAEKARVFGETDKALYHYEQAIQGAHEVKFINDEALSNELYARFWAQRGNDRFANQFHARSPQLVS